MRVEGVPGGGGEGGRVHEWTYEVRRWTDDEREVRRGAPWVNVAGSARASSLGQ